jgi:hypothetical protein
MAARQENPLPAERWVDPQRSLSRGGCFSFNVGTAIRLSSVADPNGAGHRRWIIGSRPKGVQTFGPNKIPQQHTIIGPAFQYATLPPEGDGPCLEPAFLATIRP